VQGEEAKWSSTSHASPHMEDKLASARGKGCDQWRPVEVATTLGARSSGHDQPHGKRARDRHQRERSKAVLGR
jgi:hypothetical protein